MKRGEKRDYNCGWVVEARVRGQSPKASSQLTSKGTLPTQGQPEGRDESRRRSPTWTTGGEGALGLAFSLQLGREGGLFPPQMPPWSVAQAPPATLLTLRHALVYTLRHVKDSAQDPKGEPAR